MHNAKAILTTRRAGGLFVLQSSVFRINEKLLNGEQGPALTKKSCPLYGTAQKAQENPYGIEDQASFNLLLISPTLPVALFTN